MTHIDRRVLSVAVCLALGLPATAAEFEAVPVLIDLLDEAEVPTRQAGVLAAIDAREGTSVEAGGVLARIDDAEAVFLQQRAKLEMDIAVKNAANELGVRTAEKTWEVAESIRQRTNEGAQKFRNSISQTELDRLRLDAEKAELAVQQAKHELEVARVTAQLKQTEYESACHNVKRHRIVAPFAGMVVEVYRRRGEWIELGQKLLRLVRRDRLQAEGFLPARWGRGELTGRRVTLAIDPSENLPTLFTGKIVFVSPEVDPLNGQVRMLAEIENPDLTLRPGVHATMSILAP